MKKVAAIFALVVFAAVSLAGIAMAASEENEGQPRTICPVMGGKINKEIYADHQGKRVYFCCEACKGEFAKDTEKYIRELESRGVVLEKTPQG